MPPRSDHDARMQRARLALAGVSVGDAFGQQHFFRHAWAQGPAFRQLPPAPWHYTDDTEMAIAIVDVLDRNEEIDQDDLADTFARRYSRDPARGYGATAHSILRAICHGKPWRAAAAEAFGGEGSMGNGSAMRVAPVGAYFSEDLAAVAEQARRSAEVTHTHAEGIAGGMGVAVAAAWASNWNETGRRDPPSALFDAVLAHTPESATRCGIAEAKDMPLDKWEHDVAARLGNGSRITCPDTVPFCLWAAARHLGDFCEALWTAVKVGGDIDTNAAIVGGIVALSLGPPGIPDAWLRCREPLK